MLSNSNKATKNKSKTIEEFQTLNDCKDSNASNEIMLDRFYYGKGIILPFS